MLAHLVPAALLPPALAAASAAALLRPGARRLPALGSGPHASSWPRGRPPLRVPVAGLLIGVLVLAGPVPALAAGIVLGAAGWVRRSAGSRARLEAEASAWAAALQRCAAALRAGATLDQALLSGAGPGPAAGAAGVVMAAAAGVLAAGGDPVAVLSSGGPEGGPARQLAAALRLSELTGAGPANLTGRCAQAVAAELEAAREARLALAGSAATARLLAVLPLAGIPLAGAFGASAPGFLLHGRAGSAVLVLAAVFEAAGLVWTERLSATALR